MFGKIFAKIADLAGRHVDFLKKAFSDDGTPSMSRMMTVPHSLVACWAVIYIVLHTHGIALDAATGLGGFATVHYATNRITKIFEKKKDPPPTDDAAKEQANG